MEAEFVNEYISKLIATINDFVSKNVFLETKVAMAEKTIATLQEELQELKNSKTKKVGEASV